MPRRVPTSCRTVSFHVRPTMNVSLPTPHSIRIHSCPVCLEVTSLSPDSKQYRHRQQLADQHTKFSVRILACFCSSHSPVRPRTDHCTSQRPHPHTCRAYEAGRRRFTVGIGCMSQICHSLSGRILPPLPTTYSPRQTDRADYAPSHRPTDRKHDLDGQHGPPSPVHPTRVSFIQHFSPPLPPCIFCLKLAPHSHPVHHQGGNVHGQDRIRLVTRPIRTERTHFYPQKRTTVTHTTSITQPFPPCIFCPPLEPQTRPGRHQGGHPNGRDRIR